MKSVPFETDFIWDEVQRKANFNKRFQKEAKAVYIGNDIKRI